MKAVTVSGFISFDLAQSDFCSACEAFTMPRIKELGELAKQCYALANGTLHPEARKALQEMGAKYEQQADELRRTAITRAEYPKDNKIV